MKKLKVYIASPYTKGDQVENSRVQYKMWDTLLNMEFIPFAPLWSIFQHFYNPRTWEEWMEYDLQWVAECDCLLRLPGESTGADKEVEHAQKLGIPVFYNLHELENFKFTYEEEKTKILILGHGRHGKDTVAEMLEEIGGLSFTSSSYAAAEIFLFDKLKDKFGYTSIEQCYNDRHSGDNRALWYNEIKAYNNDDKSRLAKDILKRNDMYVGMRSDEELQACKQEKLFDHIIGVYNPRIPLEESSSLTIDIFKESQYMILNNSTLDVLKDRTKQFLKSIKND